MKTRKPITLKIFFSTALCLLIVGCTNLGGDMTTVTIDLGLDEKTSQEELSLLDRFINFFSLGTEAMADSPSDLTFISLTVSGPEMNTMELSIPTETGRIVFDVPGGFSRKFSIFAETPLSPDKIYEGETVADLIPGSVVQVPMTIIAKYTSEGSIASPIYIPPNNYSNIYVGRVGKGKSYYYTTGQGDDFLNVILDGLEDDADIIEYGNDSTFTTEVQKPLFGRTVKEMVSKGGWSGNLYFAVDGSSTAYHTQFEGTSFTIFIESNNGSMAMYINEGTADNPKTIPLLPRGYYYGGMVGNDPGGESFYRATVKAGTPYWFDISSGVVKTIYRDQFVTPISSFPYTPGSDEVFIHADGDYSSFLIRIVTNEGSVSEPVYLLPEKTNFAEVGVGSSYYLFEVTQGSSYDITVTSIYNDVDLYVFDDTGFSNQVGSSEKAGTTDESVAALTATSEVFGLRIDSKTTDPSTFRITVTLN